MKTLACMILMAAAALADVSGKWSGTFTMTGPNGETRDTGIVLNLKQTGTEVTGTGGPGAEDQSPITNGKVDGDKLTFEVKRENDVVIKFNLTVDGERIKGDANGTSSDGGSRSAKVDLSKAK